MHTSDFFHHIIKETLADKDLYADKRVQIKLLTNRIDL